MTTHCDAPKPGPKPGSATSPRTPATGSSATPGADPHQFGRIDQDGTVWLITAQGERAIGSWPDGDREQAFAYYGRRFDDLLTEVVLLEKRLSIESSDPRKIKSSATALAQSLETAHVLGNVDALSTRLTQLIDQAEQKATQRQAQRDQQRADATARKEQLVTEAEELASTSTQWKSTGDRLREIATEWKTITGVDRKLDHNLWSRYLAAQETFNRRRGTHFAELDRERAQIRSLKETLCHKAEELAESQDWSATTNAFRDLLHQWKAAGRTTRESDDALWGRFKAAQDKFFEARNHANAQRDAQWEANAQQREKLLEEAERIDTTNKDAARTALRAIVTKWDAIGRVPRQRANELERRLRAIERKIREATSETPISSESLARAAQFRARAEQFERQAHKARQAGRLDDANQAEANAAQWRQWAQAAEESLTTVKK